jgi:hypothetical protein
MSRSTHITTLCKFASRASRKTPLRQPWKESLANTKMPASRISAKRKGKRGVNIIVAGNPAGADKKFERVSEHIDETSFQFLERISRFRDLFVVDDQTGT